MLGLKINHVSKWDPGCPLWVVWINLSCYKGVASAVKVIGSLKEQCHQCSENIRGRQWSQIARPYSVSDPVQHCIRWWPVACSSQIKLSSEPMLTDWRFGPQEQMSMKFENTTVFIQENHFVNVICEISSIGCLNALMKTCGACHVIVSDGFLWWLNHEAYTIALRDGARERQVQRSWSATFPIVTFPKSQ